MDPKSNKPPAVVKKKKGVKKVKKKKDGASNGEGAAVKKTKTIKKPQPKEEPFHIMSMGEIEDLFEKKNQIFQRRLKEFQKEKQQPMTLKLIFKHAFTQDPPKKEEPEEAPSEAPTETTQAESVAQEEQKVPEQNQNENEDDSGPEDNEAIIISEKNKIQEALKQSQEDYNKQAVAYGVKASQIGFNTKVFTPPVAPKITRRLGVGLAALVTKNTLKKQAEMRRKEEEELKAKKEAMAGVDEDSYYDEEDDGGEGDEDEDDIIGRGFDDDDEIDLTEFTEDDVQKQKLAILHERLEADYQKGFDPRRDPEKLLELKTLRLTFLNIGPKLQHLEFFENLETLFLQYNCIETIGMNSLQFNVNLQMLNLSNNKITELECLTHLSQLAFLDMSSNLIQSYNPVKDLPKSIIILRMAQNPFEQEDPKAYRKQSVLALEYLTEIDKIKVIQAERLFYRGLLPPQLKFSVEKKIEQFKQERMEEEAKEKLEADLYREMMEDKGVSITERIGKSLDEYQVQSEKGALGELFGAAMEKMKDQRQLIAIDQKTRLEMIEEQYKAVVKKYPGANKRKQGRKGDRAAARMKEITEEEGEDEYDDEDEENADFESYSKQLDDQAISAAKKDQGDESLTEKQLSLAKGDKAGYEIDIKAEFEEQINSFAKNINYN